MRALRKLVFGETWVLPLGVFATLAIALTLDWVADGAGWWRHAGGFVVLGCVLAVLAASLSQRVAMRRSGSSRPVEGETRVPTGTAPERR